jgi:hypothetical protein
VCLDGLGPLLRGELKPDCWVFWIAGKAARRWAWGWVGLGVGPDHSMSVAAIVGGVDVQNETCPGERGLGIGAPGQEHRGGGFENVGDGDSFVPFQQRSGLQPRSPVHPPASPAAGSAPETSAESAPPSSTHTRNDYRRMSVRPSCRAILVNTAGIFPAMSLDAVTTSCGGGCRRSTSSRCCGSPRSRPLGLAEGRAQLRRRRRAVGRHGVCQPAMGTLTMDVEEDLALRRSTKPRSENELSRSPATLTPTCAGPTAQDHRRHLT